MRSVLGPVFCILILAVVAKSQSGNPQPPQQQPPPAAETPKSVVQLAPTGFVLEEGTPVRMKISHTVSSADAQVGQTVDFEVLEDVKINGIVVVPRGGLAWATVTEARPKRRMGRAGKLGINIDAVRLVSGERVSLRAVKDLKGGSNVGKMTGAIVATSIVFFPAAPLFLFAKGKDITIPKGTEITAYVNGNASLDQAKFQPPGPADATAALPTETQFEISSTPVGAEIELDGSFVGSTPSTVNVPPGEHVIVIKKVGFKPYEKKIKAIGGKVSIAAELEAEVKPAPYFLSESSRRQFALQSEVMDQL